jgi:hypothetical protein
MRRNYRSTNSPLEVSVRSRLGLPLIVVLVLGVAHAQAPPPDVDESAPVQALTEDTDATADETTVAPPVASAPTAAATTYPIPALVPATPPVAGSLRATRGEPYNRADGGLPPLIQRPNRRPHGFDHWTGVMTADGKYTFMPDMPTAYSDAVVIAWVTGAQSYVAPDGKGSYTEYAALLTRVLMNKTSQPLAPQQQITLQRIQGLLQYPDGHLVFDRQAMGMGVPKKNGRYVFFLNWSPEGAVYKIRTGYRLAEGKVIEPLDDRGQFRIYTGLQEGLFVTRLIAAIGAQAQ